MTRFKALAEAIERDRRIEREDTRAAFSGIVSNNRRNRLIDLETAYLELWARVQALEDAVKAFKDFDDLPVQAKRPDVFELRVRQPMLRAAQQPPDTTNDTP